MCRRGGGAVRPYVCCGPPGTHLLSSSTHLLSSSMRALHAFASSCKHRSQHRKHQHATCNVTSQELTKQLWVMSTNARRHVSPIYNISVGNV